MKEMFNVAKALRKVIFNTEEWTFSGSISEPDLNDEQIPKQLYTCFRWVIKGPTAMTLSQTKMYSCLSNRQLTNKKSTTVRHTRE